MNKLLAMFAGQGAQSVGMGKDLFDASETVRGLFRDASDVLGYDLAQVCFEGPMERLTRTDVCQPAVFVMSAACLAVRREKKPDFSFDAVAGLSLGEWTALYAAGAVEFRQTVRILEARGRFMQEACDAAPSTMVCVLRLPPEKVAEVCAASGAAMANINSQEQIALSGTVEACAEAAKAAAAMGGRAVPLSVAGAYHSAFMAPAAEKLAAFLAGETLSAPAVPVLSNVTGRPHASDPEAIKKAMVAQVTSPVRWLDTVLGLRADGFTDFVEFGPGKTLSGLVRRIDREAPASSVFDLATAAG